MNIKNPLGQSLARAIESKKDALAKLIVDEQWARNPQFQVRYGTVGHAKCVHDVNYNLSYLVEAIAANSLPLFAAYIDWIQSLFKGLNIPIAEIAEVWQ